MAFDAAVRSVHERSDDLIGRASCRAGRPGRAEAADSRRIAIRTPAELTADAAPRHTRRMDAPTRTAGAGVRARENGCSVSSCTAVTCDSTTPSAADWPPRATASAAPHSSSSSHPTRPCAGIDDSSLRSGRTRARAWAAVLSASSNRIGLLSALLLICVAHVAGHDEIEARVRWCEPDRDSPTGVLPPRSCSRRPLGLGRRRRTHGERSSSRPRP